MPEAYLASSALIGEQFDGNRTIEEAKKACFAGVQLFLDPRYRNPDYLESILSGLKDSNLGIVLHMPNVVADEDVKVAEKIVDQHPTAKVLIHYIPAIELPLVDGIIVGWENSKSGPLDEDMLKHMEEVEQHVADDNTFFVYDMGRQLYASNETEIQEAISYIRAKLKSLDPTKDVIHLADKTSWILKFRDCMCALGDGIMQEFLEDIKNFDGVIVFEHENLQMALDSLNAIK